MYIQNLVQISGFFKLSEFELNDVFWKVGPSENKKTTDLIHLTWDGPVYIEWSKVIFSK